MTKKKNAAARVAGDDEPAESPVRAVTDRLDDITARLAPFTADTSTPIGKIAACVADLVDLHRRK